MSEYLGQVWDMIGGIIGFHSKVEFFVMCRFGYSPTQIFLATGVVFCKTYVSKRIYSLSEITREGLRN